MSDYTDLFKARKASREAIRLCPFHKIEINENQECDLCAAPRAPSEQQDRMEAIKGRTNKYGHNVCLLLDDRNWLLTRLEKARAALTEIADNDDDGSLNANWARDITAAALRGDDKP